MKKQLIILSLAAISLSGCKKWIDEVYLNPNKPVVVDPSLVFPGVHANMARGVQWDSRGLGNYVQMWSRTGANDTWDRMGYVAGNDFFGEKWRTHYWNLGQNLVNVINQSRQSMPEYAGAAYAMFAWSWLHLADFHGPVILKQAFDATRLTFDYDEQNEAYLHAITMADSAEFYLKRAIADPQAKSRLEKGDAYLYQGNVENYLKFAYGAKAKAYHRWWNKSDYKPDSVIKYVNLSFASVNEEPHVKHDPNPLVNDQRNFFGPSRNNLAGYRQTEWYINMMKGQYWGNVIDPRMAYMFKPSNDGQFRGGRPTFAITTTGNTGIYNFWGFLSTAAPAGGVDTAARLYFKNTVPFPLMTMAELQFIKAEAAFKKGDRALALTAYKAGIRAHFDHLRLFSGHIPFTDAQRDAFINDPNISPANPNDLTRSKIQMQKMIALWGYGFEEAWVDLRKDKYSSSIYEGFEIPANLFPDNGGKPAYRARPRYNSEYLWNVESLTKIGGFAQNYHTNEVWFVNP